MNARDDSRSVYTVGEINAAIQRALRNSFPAAVWVRGEVQRLPADAGRRQHVYFELHDSAGGEAAKFQIPVALMGWDRQRFGLSRYLDGRDEDLQLRNKLEVCLQCQVDFYPPYGKLSLKVVGIDPEYTLGRLEARRREVLAWLKQRDLLERNGRLPFPELPLRVGLITARGSAAEKDFRTGLDASPFPFRVRLADCRMMGESTEPQVVAALERLAAVGVDVIVITRGGGSRGDLSYFDQQGIARAVAECPLPVVTAIGHEIDTSIADRVAHRSCKTPTAASEFLVGTLELADERVAAAAERLVLNAGSLLEQARLRVGVARQVALRAGQRVATGRWALRELSARLETRTTRRVAEATARLDRRRGRLGAAALSCLRLAALNRTGLAGRLQPDRLLARALRQRRRLAEAGGRLNRLAPAVLQRATGRLDSLERLAGWLDPGRQLARGFSLTLDAGGRLLRSAADVAAGDRIETRLGDGRLESVVAGTPRPGARRRRKGKDRGTEEEGGQQDLFR